MQFKVYPDTKLNPDQIIVGKIVNAIKKNEGHCPCNQGSTPKEDTVCPCKKYREQHFCCCNLYVRKVEDFIVDYNE